jgi:hypothetical protein
MIKRTLAVIVATAFLASLAIPVMAAEETIKGEAVCTKCQLHETAKCGTAIRVGSTIYYVKNNKVAKAFHKDVCQASAKVVATGEVTEKDGKKTITLTKIELDK